MKHAVIIEVLLKHAFYADQQCPGFVIEPDDDTARLFRNHRCLVRSGVYGVRILSPQDAGGQPFLPLPDGATLRFHLTIADRELADDTDLGGLGGQPTFTSTGAGADGELRLTSADPSRPRLAPGVLAAVEIHPGDVPRPARFQVSFQARRARWAYYCVTDLAPTAGALSVVDASPEGPLRFSAVALDPADPVAAQIAARYPTMRAMRFVSDQPVAARAEPRRGLELRLGPDRVAGPLPQPSTLSTVEEDLLFQIVEYRTQPLQAT